MLKIDKKNEKDAFTKLIDARSDLAFASYLLRKADSDKETRIKIHCIHAKIKEAQDMIDDMLLNGYFKELYEKIDKERL